MVKCIAWTIRMQYSSGTSYDTPFVSIAVPTAASDCEPRIFYWLAQSINFLGECTLTGGDRFRSAPPKLSIRFHRTLCIVSNRVEMHFYWFGIVCRVCYCPSYQLLHASLRFRFYWPYRFAIRAHTVTLFLAWWLGPMERESDTNARQFEIEFTFTRWPGRGKFECHRAIKIVYTKSLFAAKIMDINRNTLQIMHTSTRVYMGRVSAPCPFRLLTVAPASRRTM